MIVVNKISKKYGKVLAVDNVSLQAQPGKITVLLGPNGAGKSTTIKSIAGLLNFDGDIYVNDYKNISVEAKRSFGYVSEVPMLYDALTVKEHLRFVLKSYKKEEDLEKIESLLKQFNLADHQDKLAKELSKGMSQKLSFLCALIIEPQALLVDEPLLGLDPQAIEQMLQTLVELKNNGVSILLSTHIIDMIQDFYDEAYIMDQGKIVTHIMKEEDTLPLKTIFFEQVGKIL